MAIPELRYGEVMTEQVAARQWWQNKWIWIAAGAILVIGIIGSQGGGSGKEPLAEPDTSSTPVETSQAPDTQMSADTPNVIGQWLDIAYQSLVAEGFAVTYYDSERDRNVLLLSGWIVTDQEYDGEAVRLGAKRSETTRPAAPKPTSTWTPSPRPEPTVEPEPTPTSEPEPELTTGQRNAVRSARNYLSFMGFSRSGLIDQLKYEGYSTSDAEFAVDHIDPDWNEQAAKTAQNYIDIMPFSRSSLIDQLIFEGYTREQAEYGATQVGY